MKKIIIGKLLLAKSNLAYCLITLTLPVFFTSCSLYKVTAVNTHDTAKDKAVIERYKMDGRNFILHMGSYACGLEKIRIDEENNLIEGALTSLPTETVKLKSDEGYHKLQNGKDKGAENLDVHIRVKSIIRKGINQNDELLKYNLVLYDDYTEGWNGASVNINLNDSTIFSKITLPKNKDSILYSFYAKPGQVVKVLYTEGSTPSQNHYEIFTRVNGESLIKHSQSVGKPPSNYSFVAQQDDYSNRYIKIRIEDIELITDYRRAPIASLLTKIPIVIGSAILIYLLIDFHNNFQIM